MGRGKCIQPWEDATEDGRIKMGGKFYIRVFRIGQGSE